MNCRNFLPAVATGGFLRRGIALRHAGRCPACAAALADHGELARRLAKAPPLTDGQRRLWARAPAGGLRVKSLVSRAGPDGFGWRVATSAAGAACAVVVWVVVTTRVTPPAERAGGDPPRPPAERAEGSARKVVSAAVVAVDPAEQWGRLSAGIDALDADLARLRLKAERADARRQVAVVLERHRRW